MKTSRYTSTEWLNRAVACLAVMLAVMTVTAQDVTTANIVTKVDSTINNINVVVGNDTMQASQYVQQIEDEMKIPTLQGFTLSVDIAGPIFYAFSKKGSVEAALRLSIKNQYYPIVEVGYAKCDHTDDNTNIHYSTSAPFLRLGLDYNILKNRRQDNRMMLGVRYGVSKFNYDMSGPLISDPVWGGSAPFDYHDVSSTCHWAELVMGVQVKILKYFHMGWSVRYKKELKVGEHDHSRPYYIPGYGTTTSNSCWGGTYNLIFDLRL